MSLMDARGGLDLSRAQVPPKEQRILAPSSVDILDTGGYSPMCVATLMVTDPVNLAIYFVPLTTQMVTLLRDKLAQHDPSTQPVSSEGDNHA